MMRIWIAALVIAASCAHESPYRPMSDYPGLLEATAIACTAVEMPGTCPTVVVKEGAQLTCRNSPGTQMSGFGCVGVVHPGCVCIAGQPDPNWDRVYIAREPGQTYHEMSICHEELHISLGRRTGDMNDNHKPPFNEIDSACREKLRSAGY